MRKYCNAYRLGDTGQFEGWSEHLPQSVALPSDETICYLWDDLSVVSSPFQDADVLFDTMTPEWREFCHTILNYAIPDDLRFAYTEQAQPDDVHS